MVPRPFLALALSLAVGTACVLDEVSLEGKGCPCVAGYVCDPATQTCLPPGSDGGGGPEPDAGDPGDAGDAGALEPCTFDLDCSNGRVCVDASCRSACTPGDGSCPEPATCDPVSGHCLVEGACTSSVSTGCAPPISVCVAGRCRPGCTVRGHPCQVDRVCAPSTGLCRPSPSCEADDACPSTHVCVDGTCRTRCDGPGALPCRGESACNATSGRCEGGLVLGEDCLEDRACASGECLGVRIDQMTFRFCSRACGATSDCPLGLGCVPVSEAGHCVPERLLGTNVALSQRSGESCDLADNRCQSTLCETSVCVERCRRDADCAAYQTTCVAAPRQVGGNPEVIPRCIQPFVGGEAGDACQDDADCAAGVCDPDASSCARLCCAERDCGPDESCIPIQAEGLVLGVCRPRLVGGRELGASCTDDAECASGACGPIDPNNPMGARFCTTYCCTDPDCADVPGGTRCAASAGPFPMTGLTRCAR